MPGRDIRDRITEHPTTSAFYTIEYGDTLLGVAGRAFGLPPGKERLEAARVINDAAYNDRFRGPSNKFFPSGQVSFMPKFTVDPVEQAAEDGVPAPGGHGYAALWIAGSPGDEPELEDEEEAEPPDDDADEEEEDVEPEPTPPKGPFIDWEDLHRGIAVPANKPLKIFLRPETIPVIIVPGIAGSAIEPVNPKHKKKNGPGWPVNDIGPMLKVLLRGPRRKRDNLVGRGYHDPNYFQVVGRNEPRRLFNETGLLGVAAQKYEPFVNRMLDLNQRRRETQKNPDAPLRHFYFRTPPHGFGYNWTADIALSGAALRAFVDRLGSYYRSDRGRCERCILVTHSTGGLVARAALQQDPSFADRVVAVYHNGVPHVGAAEAYFRMKCGFPQDDFKTKLVAAATMRNGYESAAVLGNIPGGLQLLPSAEYRTNAGDPGWLELVADGPSPDRKYPAKGDPYKEIYLNPNPTWGLLDRNFLNPRNKDPAEDWERYRRLIERPVRALHTDLRGVEYEHAFQVVSTGLATPDRVVLDCTNDEGAVDQFMGKALYPYVRNQGRYEIVGSMSEGDSSLWLFEMRPRGGDGDATVPTSVADGTHSGGPYAKLPMEGLPHADMLMHASCQWAIMQSIEQQLDRLIVEEDQRLAQGA